MENPEIREGINKSKTQYFEKDYERVPSRKTTKEKSGNERGCTITDDE